MNAYNNQTRQSDSPALVVATVRLRSWLEVLGLQGSGFRDPSVRIIPTMESQMEKNTNDMEAGAIHGLGMGIRLLASATLRDKVLAS